MARMDGKPVLAARRLVKQKPVFKTVDTMLKTPPSIPSGHLPRKAGEWPRQFRKARSLNESLSPLAGEMSAQLTEGGTQSATETRRPRSITTISPQPTAQMQPEISAVPE